MPKFSYLVPGKQEELELEWHSLWERVEEVARSCPDIFDTVGEIHLWLESWRSVMASLQDLDSKTESAGLTPVEPSPSLEKLIMEANKKCKSLEARVYDPSLPMALQGKSVVGNNSVNPSDKGKSRSGWTVVQDRPPVPPAPKPTSEPPLSVLFQTLHLPNSKETWCPTSYFSPELSKRSTPSPPPSPSPVIVPSWPRGNPTSRSTSPTPRSVLSSSPALSARSSFTNAREDWDEIDQFCVGNGPAKFPYPLCRLVPPPAVPPPRPLPSPSPYQTSAQRFQDFNVMSDRELNLMIERRQRDIERTQLEISRKQAEISRAVADITEWVVELRHRREGPPNTWRAK
ncbi:hypothetical protein EV401DRAFT_1926113 [Pisolithus croceorrhizus]|nr:hypothetical protein EV401DRAFT_1926113 [Pisolithus croceorrhizus]